MADYRESGIEIPRGDNAYLDGVVAISGVPQPISGWSLWFTAKYRLADPDAAAVIQKTIASGGIIITNALTGAYTVLFVPADSLGLPASRVTLYGDVQGKDPAGNIYTLDRLRFSFGPDTTISTI